MYKILRKKHNLSTLQKYTLLWILTTLQFYFKSRCLEFELMISDSSKSTVIDIWCLGLQNKCIKNDCYWKPVSIEKEVDKFINKIN